MVTISQPEPHKHRETAESFGTDPQRYDRTRPHYPGELIDTIAAVGPDVLNVGTGTGIEARQLQAAGARVLGVEPDERMAAFARESGIDVEVATFEDWDAAGRDFDTVASGTAWHWVDPVAAAAKAARILRPGGRLTVFWNVAETPGPVADAAADAIRELRPDLPVPPSGASIIDGYTAIVDKAGDGVKRSAAFAAPQRQRFDWVRHYTKQQWLDLLPTFGTLTRLPVAARETVAARVGAAIDAIGPGFTVPYATLVLTAAAKALRRRGRQGVTPPRAAAAG